MKNKRFVFCGLLFLLISFGFWRIFITQGDAVQEDGVRTEHTSSNGLNGSGATRAKVDADATAGTSHSSGSADSLEPSSDDGDTETTSGPESGRVNPELTASPLLRPLSYAEAGDKRFDPVDNARLAEGLTEPRKRFWVILREEFPEVDLTEVQVFHEMIADKRGTFGFELTDEKAGLYRVWMAEADALHREMVILRAEAQGISLGGTHEDGRGYALIGFEAGRPKYTFTTNVEAAISTGASLVRWNFDFDPALGGTVDGQNLYANINDHGEIYEHTEFQLPDSGGSRIMVAEEPWYDNANRNHMTHVAGTVSAWGYNNILLGMAPRSWIRSLIQQSTSHISTYGMLYPGELHDEVNPRTGEMQMKSVVGNTSLGTRDPNTRYTSSSRSFDIVLRDFPYYVHFYAASNDGSNFETLGGDNPVGKNVMSIGAVRDVTRDDDGNYVSGGDIASFSSRGPAYDGRIKPDFTANGVGVRSTTGTTGSSSYQGTSMASPNAAGSTLLLIDYVHQRFPGHFFRSSTYKSLLMNTADDRGNAGPDYTYGWGILNVYAAGHIIRHHAANSYHRVLREERLHPGQTWTYTYHSDGSQPVRASLAWLDVAGPSQSTTSTDRSPRLVNDLDLRITGPDGTVYEPFVMPYVTGQGDTPAFDDTLRNAPATTGDNFTDPAEQILIAAPAAGTYTVQITHKGSLSGSQPQPFSFAVSGLTSAAAAPAVITSVIPNEGNDTDNFAMAVLGSGFVLGSDVLLRRDGSPTVQAYRVVPVGDRIDFRVDTAGIDKGYYDVVVRAPDGTESVLENSFLMPAEGGISGVVTLYSNTFENADGLTLTGDWAVGVPNQGSVSGPDSAHIGSHVLGTYLNGNYENNINIFATLPPVSTVNRSNIQVEFHRWLGLAAQTTGNPNQRHRDHARIHYSLDGTTWTQLWESGGALNESSWGVQSFNLPSAVNNRAQVYFRFQLQTDGSNVSYGWNIDDLRITGETEGALLLPPVFTSSPPETATEGEAFSYSVTTSDEDTPAAELVLSAGTLPAGLSFVDNGDGTGLLSGTPTVSGFYEIELSVTDGDYTTWQIFDLQILPVGGNTPPEILTESIPAANEAQFYEAVIEAIDADGHPLSFSVSALPSWLSFADNGDGTAAFSGTPDVVSTYSITVTVTDSFETDEKTYSLSVNPRPRVGFTVSSVEVEEDAGSVTVYVARTLNDAGEVSVNYATQDGLAVAGTDYAATSGTLTWADGELGSQPVTVTIYDDELTQGDREFTINLSNLSAIATPGTSVLTVNILDNNNNTPPEITLHSPTGSRVAVPPGMGLLVSGSVTDDGLPEWGTYTQGWTVAAQPEGASVTFTDEGDLNTGIQFSHEGTYSLVFTADDGEFTDSITLTVDMTEAVTAGLPQENLALWLPLDESSGTTAADESGNSRNAELTWEPAWQPTGGAVGGALQLTTSGQRGEIADSAGLNDVNRMSWAFWLNPAGSISEDQGILGKRTSTNSSNKDWGFWFKANSNNRITFDIGLTRTETTPSIPANEWTHVAFVYDGTLDEAERMRMYVNGVFVQALSVGATSIQNNGVNVALASFQLDDNRNFIGMMDEVVIYHGRALTEEDVLQIMHGSGGNLGPLVVIDPVEGAQALEPIQMLATVTDDGLPEDPGAVTLLWEQVDGPGPVEFDDATVSHPLVTFPLSGSYLLRLGANDGQVTTFALVEVLVEESGPFAPILLTQPESLLQVAGTSTTFSVSASGNPEPVYQWFFGGDEIPGATEKSYSLASVGPEHEGNYFVRVSNDEGHVDSEVATLTILPPPATPTGVSAAALSHNSLSLSWTDPTDPPEYTDGFDLEVSVTGSEDWEPLAQVTDTEYLHSGLTPDTTRFYRVRAFNAAGASAWSATVSATTFAGVPDEILLYLFTHAEEGVNPTFAEEGLVSAPAEAGAGLNRFRTDEGGAVDTLSVVNDSTRTDVDDAYAHNEFFTITLAPEEGENLSLEALNFKITRGGTSGERNFAVRSSLDPTVNLLGPKDVVSVRGSWDVESIDLSGPEFQGLIEPITFIFIIATSGTNLSLEFDDISFVGLLAATEQEQTYTVTFVDYDGAVLKTEAVPEGQAATAPADPARTGYAFTGWDVPFDHITADLTVTAQYTMLPPVITASPEAQTVTAGESVIFTVTADSAGPLTYQWQFRADSEADWEEIGEATAAGLEIDPVWRSDAGEYRAAVTNDGGTAFSDAAVLTVNKAQAVVTLENLLHDYTAEAKFATAVTVPEGLTVVMTYADSTDAPVNAGSYAVSAVVDDENYEGSASGTLEILKAPLTVTAQDQSKTEGEADPALIWTLSVGHLYEGDALTGNLAREPGEASGYYAILEGTLTSGDNYAITFEGAVFTIYTVYGFVDSNNDGIDDDWWAENEDYFPSGATAETEVEQGGVIMKIREIFIAGLDPATDERFEMTDIDAKGMPVFDAKAGRQYRLWWTDDLTIPTDQWPVLKDFHEDMPDTAPGNGRVFYRLDVRLSE